MGRAKKAVTEVAVEEFIPDALVIRTSDPGGKSYGGCFQWPMTVGEIATCPDWDAAPACGNGLHGLLDGIGDWSLTVRDNAIWQVIGVKRSECVSIDSDKVKFPRGRVEYVGSFAGAMLMVQKATVTKLLEMADGNTATGDRGHAAATGDNGHAAATGNSGHAAATGYSGHAAATGYSGHAAATGYSGHAAATGDSGHAAATGENSIAAALGWNGTAEAADGGAVVLAYFDTNGALQHVFASKVGENGIEAGTTYRLNKAGKPEAV